MPVRGIRGAISVNDNNEREIISKSRKLLDEIIKNNPSLKPEDIGSIIFTVTDDLNATFPARAARELGWNEVPLLCSKEINVPGSLPKCIRVLIHWNTEILPKNIRHVYLDKAKKLRPDLNLENI